MGEETTVETYLHVREDALQLYGFASADERQLFELLLGVSGIGPKVALAIVSGSPPAELRRAIARDDLARFEAIPGIGRKTAERLLLELRDKLLVVAGAAAPGTPASARGDALNGLLALKDKLEGPAGAAGSSTGEVLARDALVELGWSMVDAERALADVDESLSVEEQIRSALKKAA